MLIPADGRFTTRSALPSVQRGILRSTLYPRHTNSPRKELLTNGQCTHGSCKDTGSEGQGRCAGGAPFGASVVRNGEPGCLVYRVHRSTKEPELFLFYEMYVDDAAFDLHRKAPHLAAYRLRREKEGLTDGAAEVEIFRSFTE